MGSHTPGHPSLERLQAWKRPLDLWARALRTAGDGHCRSGVGSAFQSPGHKIVDHYTYVLVSDGDLEEGISSEAGSVAGHQHLGKLIFYIADNHITIEGSTELTFTEDRMARFAAFAGTCREWEHKQMMSMPLRSHWQMPAKRRNRAIADCRTHAQLALAAPHKQDTAAAHGEALGVEEVRLTKEAMDWPASPPFHVPKRRLSISEELSLAVSVAQAEWEARFQPSRMKILTLPLSS